MRIDVYYDLLCPFCFLAKRSLDRARQRVPGSAVEVHHYPFMLYPDLPRGAHHFRQAFTDKYGEAARVPMWDAVIARGAAVGINFCFYDIEYGFHSITPHRLVHRAKQVGQESAVLDDLYSAFFEHGRYLGDTALLAEIGAAHGLDPMATKAYLDSDEDEALISQQSAAARTDPGVTGMPFHLVDGQPFKPEATGPEAFIALLRVAAAPA